MEKTESHGDTITFYYPSGPSVSVRDLWEVYPGLVGGEPSDFAADVAKAAEWSRGHERLHNLRDRFEDAAIEAVAEMGLFEDDNEPEIEEKK